MKDFFRMSFATINFLVIALYTLARELPILVELGISELKKLFIEDGESSIPPVVTPTARGRKPK